MNHDRIDYVSSSCLLIQACDSWPFGTASWNMCSPAADLGKPARQTFVAQFE